MKHEYKVGDRVVMAEDHPSYEELNAGDVVRISSLHSVGAHILKNGKEYYTIYRRLIPFREVPPKFPALPEGVQIGDEVEVACGAARLWRRERLEAITHDGRFLVKVSTDDGLAYFWQVYDHCRAIPKTITRFKSLGFLISDLERRGYKLECSGFHGTREGRLSTYTLGYLEKLSGTKYSHQEHIYAEWLEEVTDE